MLDSHFRHYCLNPRCRAKLAEPVDDDRKAFCSSGCYAGFYREHCLVCARGLPPGPGNRKTCARAACRNEYRRRPDLFRFFALAQPTRYPSVKTVERPQKRSAKSRAILPPETGRASTWAAVAGPSLSPTGFRLATLPLDAEIAARLNRANDPARIRRQSGWGRLQDEPTFGPDTPPLNVVGGYKFPSAPRLGDVLPRRVDRTPTVESVNPVSTDPFEIPEFLRRQPRSDGSGGGVPSPAVDSPSRESSGNEPVQLDLIDFLAETAP